MRASYRVRNGRVRHTRKGPPNASSDPRSSPRNAGARRGLCYDRTVDATNSSAAIVDDRRRVARHGTSRRGGVVLGVRGRDRPWWMRSSVVGERGFAARSRDDGHSPRVAESELGAVDSRGSRQGNCLSFWACGEGREKLGGVVPRAMGKSASRSQKSFLFQWFSACGRRLGPLPGSRGIVSMTYQFPIISFHLHITDAESTR